VTSSASRLRRLPAQVRLLPYKQRRTPPLDATVIYVSADRLVDKHTNMPYFVAKLRVDEEALGALKRLDDQSRLLERHATGPDFDRHVAAERAASSAYGGRSVFGWEADLEAEARNAPRQAP